MTLLRLLAGVAAACVMTVSASADEPLEILERFAEDYLEDPNFHGPVAFGVRVGDEWYSVDVGQDSAGVRAEQPSGPSLFFVTNEETLQAIAAGELNVLTAAGKAQSSDFAPFDFDSTAGFVPGPGFGPDIARFVFHFWTMGQPESVPYGVDHTRTVHGGDAAVLFYQEGFRSAYYAINPGQHVNEAPEDQVNPFPSLLIVLEGPLEARINGRRLTLEAGRAYAIPEGHPHEFWLDEDSEHIAETFLFMFGEGA